MTKRRTPKQKQVDAAWQQIREALGSLGKDLDFAREWVGDTEFIWLAQEYSAEEVVVCCGIQQVAEEVGVTPRRDMTPRDLRLFDAVADAHAALTA